MGITVQTQAKARSARKPVLAANTTEQVAHIAYELFERRGRVDGYDRQDWLEAERLVRQRRSRA